MCRPVVDRPAPILAQAKLENRVGVTLRVVRETQGAYPDANAGRSLPPVSVSLTVVHGGAKPAPPSGEYVAVRLVVEPSDEAGDILVEDAEQELPSVAAANQLLDIVCDMDMTDSSDVPELVRATALAGVALLTQCQPRDADQILDNAVALYSSWVGESSPAVEAVKLLQRSGRHLAGGGYAGFTPQDAERLHARTLSAHGPDSRQCGEVCADTAWLLHAAGHFRAAGKQAREAVRLLQAWHGPEHPVVLTAEALLELISEALPGPSFNAALRLEDGGVSTAAVGAEEAAHLASKLITAAAGPEAAYPEVVMATLLSGVVLMSQGEAKHAAQAFDEAVSQYTMWVGASSAATELVRLMRGAAEMVGGDGRLSVARAQELVECAGASGGPDSLAQGQAAAQAAWLLMAGGDVEEAGEMARQAARVQYAWHGPGHAAVAVCRILQEEIAATTGASISFPSERSLHAYVSLQLAVTSDIHTPVTVTFAIDEAEEPLQSIVKVQPGREDAFASQHGAASLSAASSHVPGGLEDSQAVVVSIVVVMQGMAAADGKLVHVQLTCQPDLVSHM